MHHYVKAGHLKITLVILEPVGMPEKHVLCAMDLIFIPVLYDFITHYRYRLVWLYNQLEWTHVYCDYDC